MRLLLRKAIDKRGGKFNTSLCFDEADHPRVPGGSPKGGEFTSKFVVPSSIPVPPSGAALTTKPRGKLLEIWEAMEDNIRVLPTERGVIFDQTGAIRTDREGNEDSCAFKDADVGKCPQSRELLPGTQPPRRTGQYGQGSLPVVCGSARRMPLPFS